MWQRPKALVIIKASGDLKKHAMAYKGGSGRELIAQHLDHQHWGFASTCFQPAQRVSNSERIGFGGPGAAAGPWEWRRARVALALQRALGQCFRIGRGA